MRVYQLAQVLGISSHELITQLRADGEWVTSHMSTVPEPYVRMLTEDRGKSHDPLPAPQRDNKRSPGFPPSSDQNPQPPTRADIRRWYRPRPGPAPLTFWEPSSRDYDDYDVDDDPSSYRAYGSHVTTRDVAQILGVSQATELSRV
jgi:hypothetical protein